MYNLVIRKCTSPPLLASRLKIINENLLPRRGSNPGPAEPEADMLPSELARRAMSCIFRVKLSEVKIVSGSLCLVKTMKPLYRVKVI